MLIVNHYLCKRISKAFIMAGTKQIRTALISVFHKDGLDDLLKKLNEEEVKFLSTGGTQHFIESLGYDCLKVEDITSYPSIWAEGSKRFTRKYSAESLHVVIMKTIANRWRNMKSLT